MRRRVMGIGWGFAVGLLIGGAVACAEEAGPVKKLAAVDAVVPVPAPILDQSQTAKKEQALKEWMAKLDGTRWSLTVTPMGEKPGKPQQDTVTFTGPQVRSEHLTKEGYSSSNFTLRLEDDGSAVWETMQGKEGGHLAFWRGNVQSGTMRGVLSKRMADGTSTDFSFSGTQLPAEAVLPATEAAVPAQPPADLTAAPVATAAPPPAQPPAADTSSKKKKRR